MSDENPLGKKQEATQQYSPDILYAISRSENRQVLGLTQSRLPFKGFDGWNAYELSWLDNTGKPRVAVLEMFVPCASSFIVESKSLKLYLNSFNFKRFESKADVLNTIKQDLEKVLASTISINLLELSTSTKNNQTTFEGESLDEEPCTIEQFVVSENCLVSDSASDLITESLYTHLFRSQCPITGQPDWASVVVRYQGSKIDRSGLLKYLLSYRNHNAYHEDCVEKIYLDIMKACQPEQLTVYARFTRRGGIDINPFRSNYEDALENFRLPRQ